MGKLIKDNKCLVDGVLQEEFNGRLLYEGADHVVSGKLNDTIENYERLIVYGYVDGLEGPGQVFSQEVLTSGRSGSGDILIPLWGGSVANDNHFYGYSARVRLSGVSFSLEREKDIDIDFGGQSFAVKDATYMRILKIVGFKN